MKITKSQLKQIITEVFDGQASSKVQLHAGLETIAAKARAAKDLEDSSKQLDEIREVALRLVEIVRNLDI